MTAKQNADYMMSANKDGAPNWFNGAYYSDRYEDLKIAFNTNEKALYNQSLQYGFNEARLVTPVLDVVKYRDFYPDLDEAFGDNWKLYVRHYFEYGIYEGRENFTDFDAKTYLSMYADLQNAFGTDLGLAIPIIRTERSIPYRGNIQMAESGVITNMMKMVTRSYPDKWIYDASGNITRKQEYDKNQNLIYDSNSDTIATPSNATPVE